MNTDTLYLHTYLNAGDFGAPIGLFSLKGNDFHEIDFHYALDGQLKKWYLKEQERPRCKIQTTKNILFEFHSKDQSITPTDKLHLCYRFDEIKTKPGSFYPRIFRPVLFIEPQFNFDSHSRIDKLEEYVLQTKNYLPLQEEVALTGVTQLSILIENLKQICQVVHPEHGNLEIYGSEIRNQLILACTEVEAQFAGIYKANTSNSSQRLSTNDYIKLLPLLKLESYSVLFNLYPFLDHFRPFANWEAKKPTESLSWYKDYNAVKHDRESEFSKATLRNLLNSIAALAILLVAQYGEGVIFWEDLIGKFFRFGQKPGWDIEEYYLPPFDGKRWFETKALGKGGVV